MKYSKIIGLCLFLIGLYLALFAHNIYWYSVFLVGGFLFLEGINRSHGFSVLKNRRAFFTVWLTFIILTLLTELIGNFWLNGWDYPYQTMIEYMVHVVLIGYPFTAFFALEFFVLIKYSYKKINWIILLVSAIIFGYINELPNIFAFEWKYNEMFLGNFLGIPILISLLWILILSVQLFEKPFYGMPRECK